MVFRFDCNVRIYFYNAYVNKAKHDEVYILHPFELPLFSY